VAVDISAGAVAIAVHGGDHPIYPDCRSDFMDEMESVFRMANPDNDIRLLTPFMAWSKGEIVKLGDKLGVDFGDTWSCYKGKEVHCGECGTCSERREAFQLVGIEDPTVYKEEVK
jgi:7-cyano-7-deazaguanine synthase